MRLAFFIARRYIRSKKSYSAINIISGISVLGVAFGTMSLIVVLSVFNGFQGLIQSLFNAFDPDLKITPALGKTFNPDSLLIELQQIDGILHYTQVIEENALIEYNKKQYIATIKGVDDNFAKVTGIDTMMVDGSFLLQKYTTPFAIVGRHIAISLSIGINLIDPMKLYVPSRTAKVSINPQSAFNTRMIHPSGVFAIQQDFDSKYIIVPLDFARSLLEYTNEVSAIEVKLKKELSENQRQKVQAKIQQLAGTTVDVKNRLQQQELLYKIMRSEKWAIFLILSFILVIASFNLIGSLTMLIIDKKADIAVLQSMGADKQLINRIFFMEGWAITWIGALTGLLLGVLLCWVQIQFGILAFPGSMIIEAYPVDMQVADFFYVLFIVLFIGFISAWYPIRILTKRHLSLN